MLLVVAIGHVAVVTLILSKEPTRNLNMFEMVSKVISFGYKVQMKLSFIILQKMVAQVRQSNPYAIQLDNLVGFANFPKPKYRDESEDLFVYLND